ncbi:MAG: FG-GAP repeat domain-containing protein [Ginsengibacter sp.]
MKKDRKLLINSAVILVVFSSTVFLFSCNNSGFKKNGTHQNTSDESIANGKKMAAMFCQSCHKLPDPSLADSKTWEKGILPQMGPRLGIFNYGFQTYPRSREIEIGANFYPSHPVLNFKQWQSILDYYEALSPDSLPPQKRTEPIKEGLSLFNIEDPSVDYNNSASSYLKILPPGSRYSVIVGDAVKNELFFLDKDLHIDDSVKTYGPVVDIDFNKNSMLACDIGVLNPNNGKFGKAEVIKQNKNGRLEKDSVPLIKDLQRPVQITTADLNNDGKPDYLVCEFGYLTGELAWFENEGNGHFKKHVLRDVPGAIKAYVTDYNHDGLPDLWVLFAQGNEGIFLFTNKGNGNFDQEQVLQFPPIYGSSYFELDDFNHDGYPDILYTCGDNADYSVELKPYHGVYIFMNDKTNHFKQKFFYPIDGCYKAIAKDFDGDGDLDIATISFFANYEKQPEEGFVYFENTGNLNFKPYSLKGTEVGRWLTMDAGDIDGDGKPDLILGNFSIGPSMMKHKVDWKKAPPFIILRNTGNKNIR